MAKIISIDTSDSKKISIELKSDGVSKKVFSNSIVLKSEAALPLIDKILRENNISLSQIDEIKVKLDSGSYTGLRVGTAIANALGFVLKIPVNGKRIGELVAPVYNK